MTTSGQGIFFDGTSTERHEVTIELAPQALSIRAADGSVIAEWSYDQLEHLSAPDHVLRLGQAGSTALARLEVRDADLATAIDHRSLPIDRSGQSDRRMRLKVIGWSVAATAVIAFAIKAIIGLRPDPEVENAGLDLAEHGEGGYEH